MKMARALAAAGFAVLSADDGDDFQAAELELLGHLDGDDVAAAGRGDKGAVGRVNIEVAQDALREAGDIFEEHGLALAIGADHDVMKRERKLDDGVEAGEGSVAGPHFLDENSAVPATENMHHSPGQDGRGK